MGVVWCIHACVGRVRKIDNENLVEEKMRERQENAVIKYESENWKEE